MSYNDLKRLAKASGVKAIGTKEALTLAILDAPTPPTPSSARRDNKLTGPEVDYDYDSAADEDLGEARGNSHSRTTTWSAAVGKVQGRTPMTELPPSTWTAERDGGGDVSDEQDEEADEEDEDLKVYGVPSAAEGRKPNALSCSRQDRNKGKQVLLRGKENRPPVASSRDSTIVTAPGSPKFSDEFAQARPVATQQARSRANKAPLTEARKM